MVDSVVNHLLHVVHSFNPSGATGREITLCADETTADWSSSQSGQQTDLHDMPIHQTCQVIVSSHHTFFGNI